MKINMNVFYLSMLSSIIIFFPSLSMILLQQSSFTLGVVLASSFFIACRLLVTPRRLYLDIEHRRSISIILCFLVFVFFHFALVFYIFGTSLPEQDFPKFLLSFIFLMLVLVANVIVKDVIYYVDEKTLHSTLKVILYILLLNALVSLTKIDVFGTGLAKPTFLFQEPSHFALICAPVLMYFSFIYAGTTTRLIILFMFALWGGYIQNFTMILAAAIAFIITARSVSFTLLVCLLFGLVGFFFLQSDLFSYYTARLNLSSGNQNLSTLVLLQGWQNAFLTMNASWLGSGFQQFGISTLSGDISQQIYSLLRIYINVFDGGSTAAKVVGEFGVFGIALMIVYLIGWLKIFFYIRKHKKSNNKKIILFASLYLASILEFFVRGAGYFTPSMFFFSVSVFYFMSRTNKKRIIYEINN